MSLPPDYHTHTSLCKHAKGKVLDYAKEAVKKNLSQLAATDHCPNDHQYDPSHRMELDEYETYCAWIQEARDVEGVAILKGVEADFYQGCYLSLKAFLEEQEDLDVVLGSVHYQFYWSEKPEEKSWFEAKDLLPVWKRYFRLVALMAETGLYDVAAHFDLPKKMGFIPEEDFILECAEPALDAIARAGMAIEINTSGLIHKVKEMYPSLPLLTMACQKNIPLTFGSDAHDPSRVGADFDKAIALAKKAGYSEYAQFSKRQFTLQPLD